MKSKIFLMALSLAFGLTSCNKELFVEEDGDGSMSIDRFYYENASSSTNKEIQTDYARLGQTIRITGSGFKGLKHVYINGYDTYFNLQYLSNTSMLITIDEDTPIEQVNESANKNKIKLVKNNCTASKTLRIRRAAPVVSDVSNSMPNPGEWITIYGSNLQYVTSVTFPGADLATVYAEDGLVESDDVNGTYVRVKVPSNLDVSLGSKNQNQGAIQINAEEDGNGVCNTPDYFNYRKGLIENFEQGTAYCSSLGETDTESAIWTATAPANCASDSCSNDGAYLVLNSSNVKIPVASLSSSAGLYSYFRESWSTLKNVPTELDDLAASEVGLQFNVMCPSSWLSGSIYVLFPYDNKTYKFCYSPWVTGTTDNYSKGFCANSWFTVTVPFNTITDFSELTFKQIRQKLLALDDGSSAWAIALVNDDKSSVLNGITEEFKAQEVKIQPCIDNIRIVPLTVEVEEVQ